MTVEGRAAAVNATVIAASRSDRSGRMHSMARPNCWNAPY